MEPRIGHSQPIRIRYFTRRGANLARRIAASATLALAILSLAGCDKPLGDFELDLSGPSPQVRFAGSLENAEGLATISGFRVLLNGTPAQSTTLGQAAAAAPLAGSWPAARDQQHRLSIVIDAQTASPSVYRVTLTVRHENSSGQVTRELTLDPRNVSVQTGEAIEYTFRL